MRDDDPSPIPCFLPTGIAYKSSSSQDLHYQGSLQQPYIRGKLNNSNAVSLASSSSSSESLDYFGSDSNSPRSSSFSSTHSFQSPSLSPSESIWSISNMALRRFAQRQADLLHEQRPNLHVVVVALPPKDGALQLDGTRDYNGERTADGELVTYEKIFYASAFTEDVVFCVYLFEQGRLTLDKMNESLTLSSPSNSVYAFASLSWEKFGPYVFFDPMSPI
ncbi:BZ3500_MvSof-1268-A1-R1_Chr5-2g07932 [Microbotryum saponariae]|uniref:BZ3500_MvSof-1268-A1-R1_Chr5-2g07932 protein n=1 Tax=Microbotryum saponariae TaxID=289078 RepID=A0A2X0LFV1_9BASI|nr:BZ3500_MvSof-1268-A1-R1_Chr5-2g07932 [Microbotryum saponariae]SDA05801.1 BZ3501_MvSof-1269-A2-R1_Chr5-2g07754 [Microbotryum saponariae]